MTTPPLSMPGVTGPLSEPARARLASQQSFAASLGRRLDQGAGGERVTAEEAARRAARTLVSQAFVQQMLKLLRETNQAAPPFRPGPGEKQFRSLMDAELAERIVGASRFALVDRIAADLSRRAGAIQEVRTATGGGAARMEGVR
ncbi:hypothetical protein J4558_18970 [Leptolyngbya sp. 15MV]|nr:hypothetical protein J4558_18970 [Leptolyngbya sp. 15MV]